MVSKRPTPPFEVRTTATATAARPRHFLAPPFEPCPAVAEPPAPGWRGFWEGGVAGADLAAGGRPLKQAQRGRVG